MNGQPAEECWNHLGVVGALRRRASSIRLQGVFILGLALGALVGGAILFQAAADLSPQIKFPVLPDGSDTRTHVVRDTSAATATSIDATGSVQGSSVPVILGTVGTRIGLVIVVAYLVQLLVGTYRYNTRMAAYYESRADALELSGSRRDSKVFGELVGILSPDHINFGKAPVFGSDTLIDLVRTGLGRSNT
jgi:hypothetical protein